MKKTNLPKTIRTKGAGTVPLPVVQQPETFVSSKTTELQPPDNLCDTARKIWSELIEVNADKVTPSNSRVFGELCRLYADIEDCDKVIEKSGTTIGLRIRPEVKIKESCRRLALMYSKELKIVGLKHPKPVQ